MPVSRSRRLPRRAARLALLLIAAASLACGGGGGGGHDSGPAFSCSDSPVGANNVALVCGAKISRDTWLIEAVIGGPTSSNDIWGFTFDVVFPIADLSYVPGSAELGTLLSQGGGTPLLAADLASDDPGRLVIGIDRTNQALGVQGAAPQNLILKFRLKTNAIPPFGPDLIRFENAEAVNSSKLPIAGITFSDQLLLSVN